MKKRRGPVPEVLKIEGGWKDAMAKMLRGGDAPKAKATKKKRKGKR